MPEREGSTGSKELSALERIRAIVENAQPVETPIQAQSYRRIDAIVEAAAPIEAPEVKATGNKSPVKIRKRASQNSNRHSHGGDGDRDPPAGTSASEEPNDDQINLRLAFFPQTDVGNAERLIARSKGLLLWSPGLEWLSWSTRHWASDLGKRRRAFAHSTARAVQQEARALRTSALDLPVVVGKSEKMMSDLLSQHGRKSEQAPRLSAMLDEAAHYLCVFPETLDADPFKFNVANGTLQIRKTEDGSDYVQLLPHDPSHLITKLSTVVFDPAAECPIFDEFFEFVQPKPEMRRFLMQWQGLSLTGDVTEQKLCIYYGSGRNGKSTFVDACAHVGGDYSASVPIETFLRGRGREAGQASPDLAILPGVRHLRTSEPDKGAKLAEALIKLVTGGEPIMARHLNKEYFKFYPQFKLTISGNHKPGIQDSTLGIWRRVKAVPWSIEVPEDKIDPHLGDKLRAEASGILNRLLDGLRDWLDNGLVFPDDVIAATADYRRDSDPCGRFLEECIAVKPGGRTRSSEMHGLFCAWAKANFATVWSAKGLAAALKDRGYRAMHSNGMQWLDVELTRTASDFDFLEATDDETMTDDDTVR
jgi:putative DNA primase/helicase